MMATANRIPPAEWKYDRPGYLLAHPAPLPYSEPEAGFMTDSLLMHRAFYAPIDPVSANNPEALAAHRWSRQIYTLFKRALGARERCVKATTAEAAQNAADQLRSLVEQIELKLEEYREIHAYFKNYMPELARSKSPYFNAVSMWTVVDRYMRESFSEEEGVVDWYTRESFSEKGVAL